MSKKGKKRELWDNSCPVCGEQALYDAWVHDDLGCTIDFQCPACGATGTEVYDLNFRGFSNLHDKDGNEIYELPEGQ